jgi:hypothetical protein
LLDYLAGNITPPRALVTGGSGLVVICTCWMFGTTFYHNIHFGRRKAIIALIPAALAVGGVAWFLWAYAGPGVVEISQMFAAALTALALSAVITTTNAMRSRRQAAATAFRKTLAAGREYFERELKKDSPAISDDWMPWLLAFGLGPRVEDWTSQREARSESSHGPRSPSVTTSTPTSTASSGSSSSGWTGFSGGRSGGAGGGAAWTAAAGSLAAGVSPPSSSGSSGGGGSSSSSSSGSSSSGGGGGGGW